MVSIDYCKCATRLRRSRLTQAVTQYYAPMGGHTFKTSQGENWLLLYYFNLALQNDVLFEANVLHMASLIPADWLGLSREKYEESMLLQRGSVMRKLQERLAISDTRTTDATILAVTTLMVTDVSQSNQDICFC
jgi:hypothetical protein